MKIVQENINEIIKHLSPRSEKELAEVEAKIRKDVGQWIFDSKQGYADAETVDEIGEYVGINTNDVDDVKSLMGDLISLLIFKDQKHANQILYELVKRYESF